MANYSPNLNLELPLQTEFYDIDKFNANFSIIDGVAHNENLLDNAWFINQINQRGITDSTWLNDHYGIDRWKRNGMCVIHLLANGIGIARASDQTFSYFDQRIEAKKVVVGKTYTASVIVDGVLVSGSFVMPSLGSAVVVTRVGDIELYIRHDSFENNGVTNQVVQFDIRTYSTTQKVLKCAKLEEGSVSTLLNDSAPDYASNFLRCMRFYKRITGAYVGSSDGDGTHISIEHFPPMRAKGSLSGVTANLIKLSGTSTYWNGVACTMRATSTGQYTNIDIPTIKQGNTMLGVWIQGYVTAEL